jgi:hypothetical protein
MPEKAVDAREASRLRTLALSRWENEGGAAIDRADTGSDDEQIGGPVLSNVELVQLRIRVIALENLVIALLAQAPERQLVLAREMAAHISPRPGFTPHPLTIRAANEMLSLVDRAGRFRFTPCCG